MASDAQESSGEPLLPTPGELRARMPLVGAAADTVARSRAQVRAIFEGQDDRLLVIAGPCSVHDPEAVMDVAGRLQALADPHASEVVVLMRAYFEKARTHVGWKGFLNDPHLDGTCDVAHGVIESRRLLLALSKSGIGTATELLDPHAVGYFSDLFSWAAIGARTSESQSHREMASGFPVPVGFKNGTDGEVESALWAVRAAASAHSHMAVNDDGRLVARRTPGNPHAHVVLRGGRSGPNYSADHLAAVLRAQAEQRVPCPIVIDCSHANSDKQPERQPQVADAVARQVEQGQRAIVGVMLESHLVAGRQDIVRGVPLRYGQSVTDGCIDMGATGECIERLADAVRRRRARRGPLVSADVFGGV